MPPFLLSIINLVVAFAILTRSSLISKLIGLPKSAIVHCSGVSKPSTTLKPSPSLAEINKSENEPVSKFLVTKTPAF